MKAPSNSVHPASGDGKRPFGCALAMGVLQSELYKRLDEVERAECDELVRRNLDWFKGDSSPQDATAEAPEVQWVEATAKAIYDQWRHLDGWVPWVERGNSTKQSDARRMAREFLPAAARVTQAVPQPLTNAQLMDMRRDARNNPSCADEHWFILFARAIEAAHGITLTGER